MTALRHVPTLMVGSLALVSQDINFSVTTKHVKVKCLTCKSCDSSVSKNTDSSVFYTEIGAKILNTDSDPQKTDRDPIIRVIAIQQITATLR